MVEVENDLRRLTQGQRGAGGTGVAMMQAGHGIEQMGESGRTCGQRRAGLREATGGVPDLGTRAEPAKVGQQRAVRVDLGRIGGDPIGARAASSSSRE